MRILGIVQARMTSSRLPGKVLVDIGGQPMLARVVERLRRAKVMDDVLVATTLDPTDDAVQAFCERRGYPCYRGSVHDVLDRYFQAALAFGADVIVRVTGDCPFIDSDVVSETVSRFLGQPASSQTGMDESERTPQEQFPWDFAANRLPPPWRRTYPIGLDTEVCTFQALERAWREASLKHQREHVMPYLYEQPGRFRVLVVNHEPDYGGYRWTVDTPEDLELARRIYAHFQNRDEFSWRDILAFFENHPELAAINANVRQKVYIETDEPGSRRDDVSIP
jgi:spore coat polysaccharide biosynthesis protein SpsF